MPIWLRKFTFSQIQEYHDNEKKRMSEVKEKGKKSLVTPDGKVNVPAFAEASKPYKGKTSYK